MPNTVEPTAGRAPAAAFTALDAHVFRASQLTRGPWHPQQQHAGPPIALAESALYDEVGLIGRATQSLFVRKRSE